MILFYDSCQGNINIKYNEMKKLHTKEIIQKNSLTRRTFIKTSAKLGAFASIAPMVGGSPLDIIKPSEPIPESLSQGIQIGAVSFVDEGVERVLDILQEKGAVNTLYPTVFTYGRGLAGRQIPGHKFPDHGSQESDSSTFHGGNYSIPNAKFYKNTVLKQVRAPEHGDFDILASVIPSARKRGMKVFASIEDQWRNDVPGIDQCYEVDFMGRQANALCLFNPNVREFWKALVADISTSYDVDGILLFNERSGPLLNSLGASHFQSIDSSRSTCFCPFHQNEAKKLGINIERAREGYIKLDKFIRASLEGHRPTDGYYVEFSRLLLNYPEITAWDRLFDESKHAVLQEVNSTAKSINKDLKVGFHIEHVNSFNPYFRAGRSYEELAKKADFFKVVAYNNCGGERYAKFINNVQSTIFRDVPAETLMRFNNHLLNYGNEAGMENLAMEGLSSDYVFRETQRAIAGANGKCKIYTGIDIGIPTGSESRKTSPSGVYEVTLAAYRGGANGVILSRKYSEMNLTEIAAAGRAFKDAIKV